MDHNHEIESRYRALIEFAADAILLGDSRGDLIGVNASAIALTGYSREELLRMNISALFSAEEQQRAPLRYDLLLAGEAVLAERLLTRKDGRTVAIEMHSKRMPDGNYHAFIRDVSAQYAAKLEREREGAIERALAALYLPLASPGTTIEGMAGLVFKHACELTGSRHGFVSTIDPATGNNISHTLSEMMENQCRVTPERRSIVFPPNPNGTFPGLWGSALNSRRSFFTNQPATHPASTGLPPGHLALERFLAVPVLLGEEPVGLIALANPAQDYTEKDLAAIERLAQFYTLAIQKMRYEAALVQAREAAEAANRAKSDFLANMSHELRTPLGGIVGMASLLRQSELNERQQNYLASIESSADNLLGLVNDILDLSRIEANRITLEADEFSLPDCLDGVIAQERPLLDRKGLQLQIEIDDRIPQRLVGDELRCRQIFTNLVNNAIKFTDAGTIAVAATLRSLHDERMTVEFRVHDSGIGMSKELQQRIFHPFEQGDTALSRRRGGAGLGLAICHHLVELMGGAIRVDSRPGCGTTFYVTLPLGRVAQGPRHAAEQPPARTIAGIGRPLAILLAEDNMINAMFLSDLLEGEGHTVTCASDGQQALALWHRGEFDLVLLDVQMPVLDGVAVVGMIREEEGRGRRKTPVLALTAYALAGDREKFLAAGFDGYLSKPFSNEALFTAIREQL